MSKIARIYQGLEEIQKYYQGGVLQRLFFDWKHYIGNELNIEYAKECAGRNVVIEGKTYQNLFKAELNQGHANSSYSDTVPYNTRINSVGFTLPIGTYTITISNKYELLIYKNYGSYGNTYLGWLNKITWANGSQSNNIRIMVRKVDNSNVTVDEVIGKVILLEGDYTNIDLPTPIDGIESVGEREFVKSKNLCPYLEDGGLNDKGEEYPYSDSIRSPFIYLNAGNYVTSNNNVFRPTNIYIYDLNKKFKNRLLSVNTFSLTENVYVRLSGRKVNRDKFQLELGNTPTEYEPFYEYYPVTIRNYNYKCDTDNIVLPNGVKNSIDTIDGKKVHVQRVWKRVFDGSDDEKWRNGYGNGDGKNNRFEMEINSKGSYSNTYMNLNIVASVCSHFKYEITNAIPKSFGHYRISFNNSLGKIFLLFNPSTNIVPLENVSAWKAWLSENPVTVWYELATPIYTYLESGLYDDITLPDGTKNEISYNGEKYIHIRKIDKVIFDGSNDENWGTSGLTPQTETIIFQTAIIANTAISNSSLLCDIYSTLPDFSTDNIEGIRIGGTNNTRLYVRIKRSNLETEDINGFKAYLAENPLDVYYELAEPVISDLYYDDITYKLSEPLRSLTDKIYDYIKEGKITRKIGKYTFTNKNYFSTPFGTGNLNNGTRLFETTIIPSKTSKIICDKFNYVAWSDIADSSKIAIARFTNSGNLIFRHNSASLQEFQNYLLENPVTVYYELATPIETPITPDMILINGEPITDTVGIELPNGIKDIMEKGIYTKNINKIVLDGSDDELWVETNWSAKWGQTHNGAKVFEYRNLRDTSYMASNNQNNFLYESTDTTLSPYYGTNSKELPENAFICKGAYIDFGCHFDTVEDFRNFLAENPFTIQYELMNPIKIPLFSIKEGLTTLKSTNNITPQIELDCLVREDFQNLCDNVWEVDPSNANNIVTKNFIDVSNGTYKKFYIENLNNFSCDEMGIYGYNENDTKLVTWNPFPRPLIMPDLNIKKIKIFISGNNIEPRLYINHNTNKVLGEWETGSIDSSTGENIVNGFIRMKDYIKVTPNTKYLITMWNSKAWIAFSSYDKNKNFISKISTLKKEFALITDENTYFIRINTASTFPNIPDIKITKIE